MSAIVRQLRSLPALAIRKWRGEARFEKLEALETIGPDLTSSFFSQSLTEESEVDETPIKTDGTR